MKNIIITNYIQYYEFVLMMVFPIDSTNEMEKIQLMKAHIMNQLLFINSCLVNNKY